MMLDHCALSASLSEAGEPQDRTIFHAGTAAHAILQALVEATNKEGRPLEYDEMERVARKVCERLISHGRKFEGVPEPPLPADLVWRGRDAALDYIGAQPFEPGGMAEVGLAVDAEWQPCEYDSERRHFRHIVDYLELRDGDPESDYPEKLVTVRDYKGWLGTKERLDHLQQRAAAVLAWIHYPEATVLIREVVNIFTGATFSETIYLAYPEEVEKLEEWKKDIDSTLAAYEEAKRRGVDGLAAASPGPGCVDCPYLNRCDEGLEYWRSVGSIAEYGSVEEKARAYAVCVAVQGALRKMLELETGGEPVETGEGEKVGYVRQSYREVKPGAHRALLAEYGIDGAQSETFAAVLAAHGMSVSGMESALKALGYDKQFVADWLAEQTVDTGRKVFKVTKA